MTTRLDVAIQKAPEHEEAIRLFAERDPSGSLKYLAWQVKVLSSGQALAPEIADVVEMFHRHAMGRYPLRGRRRGAKIPILRPDLYSYRPGDLAMLRDTLLTLDRLRAKKRAKVEKLYKLEGPVEADVIFQAPDLVVRHIKNKEASVHYGLGTKWCVSMKRHHYFEDYDTQNATFFFFERAPAARKKDAYDKAAIMLSRGLDGQVRGAKCFTAEDEHTDVMSLATAYGPRVFEALRLAYDASAGYPGSIATRVFSGKATEAELRETMGTLGRDKTGMDGGRLLEAVVCNDAAPWDVLEAALALDLSPIAFSDYRRWTVRAPSAPARPSLPTCTPSTPPFPFPESTTSFNFG